MHHLVLLLHFSLLPKVVQFLDLLHYDLPFFLEFKIFIIVITSTRVANRQRRRSLIILCSIFLRFFELGDSFLFFFIWIDIADTYLFISHVLPPWSALWPSVQSIFWILFLSYVCVWVYEGTFFLLSQKTRVYRRSSPTSIRLKLAYLPNLHFLLLYFILLPSLVVMTQPDHLLLEVKELSESNSVLKVPEQSEHYIIEHTEGIETNSSAQH